MAFTPNPLELAWAAGFLDGEGTIVAQARGKRGVRSITISVSQAGEYAPALLGRFAKAVGFGTIYTCHGSKRKAHYKQGYAWRVGTFEKVQATVALLWNFLGPAKRAQAKKAMREYLNSPHGLIPMTSERGKAMAERRWGYRKVQSAKTV